MQTTKQQKWRKRPLNILLATTLVSSNLSFMGAPQQVKAADLDPALVGPGYTGCGTLHKWWLPQTKLNFYVSGILT